MVQAGLSSDIVGSASGNRTRISALKGPRANRCTIAPHGELSRSIDRLEEISRIDKDLPVIVSVAHDMSG
jgi:hypothetical protein